MPIRNWSIEDLLEINALLGKLSQSIGFDYHNNLNLLKNHFILMGQFPNFYSTYVYIVDDKIVGLVSIVFYSSALHRKGTALINELIVADGFRSKGIGSELLAYCINIAKQDGFDEVEVGTEKGNIRAIEFYKKNGFDKEYILLGKEF